MVVDVGIVVLIVLYYFVVFCGVGFVISECDGVCMFYLWILFGEVMVGVVF